MNSAPTADDFFRALCRLTGRRKRIEAKPYRDVFNDLCPALPVPEARAKLAGWLTQLAENGDLRLPKGRRLYDRAETGDLPAWVELVRPEAADESLPVDPETFAWAQELRFACTVRDARQLDVLLRVQRFLASGGRERALVPMKERSVELFGHEKRLDMMRGGSLFAPGRLSLDLLRCFPVPPVLWHEAVALPDGRRPVLVIENHSTYHSFARWSREAREFCATVYGHGDAFKSSAAGLVELLPQWSWDGRLFYFGDLDPEGLIIPLAASATISTLELPPLQSHQGCYQRLIDRAKDTMLPAAEKLGCPTDALSWLGSDIATQLQPWFDRGIRLAQELVGWEELQKDGDCFVPVAPTP